MSAEGRKGILGGFQSLSRVLKRRLGRDWLVRAAFIWKGPPESLWLLWISGLLGGDGMSHTHLLCQGGSRCLQEWDLQGFKNSLEVKLCS